MDGSGKIQRLGIIGTEPCLHADGGTAGESGGGTGKLLGGQQLHLELAFAPQSGSGRPGEEGGGGIPGEHRKEDRWISDSHHHPQSPVAVIHSPVEALPATGHEH